MFKDIAVGIRTFLRDDKLFVAVEGILSNMPGAQIIIADDGEPSLPKLHLYEELSLSGHHVFTCPLDSGFGYKSNVIVNANERPYLLIGSDDFDFTPKAAEGILAMHRIMEANPWLDILSGSLNNRPYEFFLEDRGDVIIEHQMKRDGTRLQLCDLTVNYSLIRKHVFEKVQFDDAEIIGEGGHGAFFVDVKRAGFKVGFTPLAEISEQKGQDSQRYQQFRQRACGPSRKSFDRRGIRKYVLGNGTIDYDVTSRS